MIISQYPRELGDLYPVDHPPPYSSMFLSTSSIAKIDADAKNNVSKDPELNPPAYDISRLPSMNRSNTNPVGKSNANIIATNDIDPAPSQTTSDDEHVYPIMPQPFQLAN